MTRPDGSSGGRSRVERLTARPSPPNSPEALAARQLNRVLVAGSFLLAAGGLVGVCGRQLGLQRLSGCYNKARDISIWRLVRSGWMAIKQQRLFLIPLGSDLRNGFRCSGALQGVLVTEQPEQAVKVFLGMQRLLR